MMPRISTTGLFDTIFAQSGSFTFNLPPGAGTLALTANITTETNRALAAEALLAPLASPALTGGPTAPTAAPGNNTTQLATTAFSAAAVLVETNRATAAEALKAPLASPALTGTPTAPSPAFGDNSTRIATSASVARLAQRSTVLVAGAVDVTLTTTDVGFGLIYLYGAITANINVIFPVASGTNNIWWVENATSGAFTVTLKGTSGGTILLRQGGGMGVWTDGAGIYPTMTDGSTAAPGTNTTQLATTAFSAAAVLVETNRATAAEGSETTRATAAEANSIGRNEAHNGLFNVQQRGAGPWTTNTYTADRWVTGLVGDTVSATLVALADADRTAIGDEAAEFSYQSVVTGAATAPNLTSMLHRFENVRRHAGKTVTVSFWAKVTPALNIGVSFNQSFGTGGSPSAGVNVAPITKAVTSGWTRYSATFAIPSIVGKTVGTNGDHYTQLNLALSSGTNNAASLGVGAQSGTFNVWGVQVEVGSVATALEKRPAGLELALCQRFYARVSVFGGSYTAAGFNAWASGALPVTMRATPTLVIASNASTNSSGYSVSPDAENRAVTASAVATATAGTNLNMGVTASADL